MDNVIPIGGITLLDIPEDQILEQAKGKMNGVVLMGWDEDGDLYFASSFADGGSVLWLMEKCKEALLNIEVE